VHERTPDVAALIQATCCFGWVASGVLSVRFTYREGRIRIFGAGYWRKGKRLYEQQNA